MSNGVEGGLAAAIGGVMVLSIIAIKGAALMGATAIAANFITGLEGFSFLASVGIVVLGGIVTAGIDLRG